MVDFISAPGIFRNRRRRFFRHCRPDFFVIPLGKDHFFVNIVIFSKSVDFGLLNYQIPGLFLRQKLPVSLNFGPRISVLSEKYIVIEGLTFARNL